ncbi:phosphonate ABC transporter ATP-binding protein [Roseibium album]|uniref:phosphonate ABC transporter ATP-binding protein n=1 Tax=Roseibium album TaxID=311410 RepID=UPI002493BF33|nr:phosphonate ABC transporter ATP-binding protein [Roseibium album]
MAQAQVQVSGVEAPVTISRTSAAESVRELSVSGLVKSFGKDKGILHGISFSVHRRESVALIGSNGAGKSTALRCALRLIEPDDGSVHLFDDEITSMQPSRLRKVRADVGFVFQKHNLVPRISALSNVLHGNLGRVGGMRGWSQLFASTALRERAMSCLDRVGLADQAMKRADQLSGGQSQRVAIARALMQEPRMIVADEPVASLDPIAGQEVMELFHQLTQEKGITLLFTSHNVEQALAYSDRVIAIRRGTIVLDAASNTLSLSDLGKHYG